MEYQPNIKRTEKEEILAESFLDSPVRNVERETLFPEEAEFSETKKRIVDKWLERNTGDPLAELGDFLVGLEQTHPDIRRYSLYHMGLGSSLPVNVADKIDLEGEESMLSFIRNLEKKYASETN